MRPEEVGLMFIHTTLNTEAHMHWHKLIALNLCTNTRFLPGATVLTFAVEKWRVFCCVARDHSRLKLLLYRLPLGDMR